METLKKWVSEVVGYSVSFCCMIIPSSCQEWTNLFAFLIAGVTLFFITLPKAWPNIRKFWKSLGVLP